MRAVELLENDEGHITNMVWFERNQSAYFTRSKSKFIYRITIELDLYKAFIDGVDHEITAIVPIALDRNRFIVTIKGYILTIIWDGCKPMAKVEVPKALKYLENSNPFTAYNQLAFGFSQRRRSIMDNDFFTVSVDATTSAKRHIQHSQMIKIKDGTYCKKVINEYPATKRKIQRILFYPNDYSRAPVFFLSSSGIKQFGENPNSGLTVVKTSTLRGYRMTDFSIDTRKGIVFATTSSAVIVRHTLVERDTYMFKLPDVPPRTVATSITLINSEDMFLAYYRENGSSYIAKINLKFQRR